MRSKDKGCEAGGATARRSGAGHVSKANRAAAGAREGVRESGSDRRRIACGASQFVVRLRARHVARPSCCVT
ncbi:hypothetical protein CFB49_20360 [Burkholderia sp. AU17457]|nr:hypothetical protein CFB49_20360 [Burkholderia sp. AU17457]